jgi:hypothetical protein
MLNRSQAHLLKTLSTPAFADPYSTPKNTRKHHSTRSTLYILPTFASHPLAALNIYLESIAARRTAVDGLLRLGQAAMALAVGWAPNKILPKCTSKPPIFRKTEVAMLQVWHAGGEQTIYCV